VSNIPNPLYITQISANLVFTGTVTASDDATLVSPNSQSQTYTLTTSTGTVHINGNRITDSIAAALSTNLSTYNAAAA
jgi:hypothetical protein